MLGMTSTESKTDVDEENPYFNTARSSMKVRTARKSTFYNTQRSSTSMVNTNKPVFMSDVTNIFKTHFTAAPHGNTSSFVQRARSV